MLTTISFLIKRVQQPTQEDFEKLKRLIRYMRGTKEFGIILEADKILNVMGFVDAS